MSPIRCFLRPALAALILAFTASGCIDLGALKGDLKAQVDATSAKNVELQRAVSELSGQVRTLNEENNSVKALLSKVSDSVLAQQTKIEELEGQLRAVQSAPRPTSSGSSSSSGRSKRK